MNANHMRWRETMPVIGTQQSPIEIDVKKAILMAGAEDLLKIEYSEEALGGHYEDDHFAFDKRARPAKILFGGEPWRLRQLHIHNGAEHLIEGRGRASFECHLLHTREDDPDLRGEKFVIGVLFEVRKTPSSPKADPRLHHFAELGRAMHRACDEGKHACVPCTVAPKAFLPKEESDWKRWFRYEGSLTTDPYSEDVSWLILDAVALVPETKEVKEVMEYADQKARKVHALDRRFVLRNFPIEGEKPTAHKPAATLAAKAPKGKRARA